ncbi:MAG: nucleotide exchange factor GrpE [Spirochaetaceae bacterium]|jgi:molecular chaperone GrpE|nr:nucleotide exchange factor GrpE [Spirochaetaceae bacterium]
MSKHTSHDDKHREGEVISPGDTGGQRPDEAEIPASEEMEAGCGAKSPDPAAQIQDLEAKLAGANDQYLRKAAEFENFRKRMNREKQEAIDYANQTLLLDLIPIIDDFERAIKSAESAGSTSPEFTSLYEGISMIEKRLVSQLENKWGLKRFDSAGEVFDPTRHEAIMMEKSAEISEPLVAEDFIKGYILKDRVVRSAKVKVLMPEETQNAEDTPPENGEGT